MSSFKRIPKSMVRMGAEQVLGNDQAIKPREEFRKAVEEDAAKQIHHKRSEAEASLLQEIGEMRQQLVRQAYEEGREMAVREAVEIIRAENQAVLARANEIYEEANRHLRFLMEESEAKRARYEQENARALIDLSIAAAEKIMRKEVELFPVLVEQLFGEALAEIRGKTKRVAVRLHPETLKVLGEEQRAKLGGRIEFFCDLELAYGDFKVETDQENIDFALGSQLEELREKLRSVADGD